MYEGSHTGVSVGCVWRHWHTTTQPWLDTKHQQPNITKNDTQMLYLYDLILMSRTLFNGRWETPTCVVDDGGVVGGVAALTLVKVLQLQVIVMDPQVWRLDVRLVAFTAAATNAAVMHLISYWILLSAASVPQGAVQRVVEMHMKSSKQDGC